MSRGSMLRCALAVAVVLAGCASGRDGREAAAIGASSGAPCASETALPKELREPGGVVLFGEVHGVKELPWFFGEAVCTAVASGLRVVVGLEMPAAEQAAVDLFLASPGGEPDVDTLLTTPFWMSVSQDGRASHARLALLQRLRDLSAQGLALDVFLFDVHATGSPGAREEAMAVSIAAHARAHPEAFTVVLVGDVHAWKAKGTPWDPEYLPMGWHLAQTGIRIRSLGRSTPAGTSWGCAGGLPADCGPGEVKATRPLPSGRTTGIELLPEPSMRGNDGLYATPSLTMSPPAYPFHE